MEGPFYRLAIADLAARNEQGTRRLRVSCNFQVCKRMQLTVKGKQIDVGDALRAHVADALSVIFDKYFGEPIEATVQFSREAHLIKVHISVHVGRGILLQSEAGADAPYPAFDLAADLIAKRMRRYKRRLRDHHRYAAPETLPAQQYILANETEDESGNEGGGQPVIVAEMAEPIHTLSVSEAVMRMDLANINALLFRNSGHGGLNMVYRRNDGNIGWVDPSGNGQGLEGKPSLKTKTSEMAE